MKSVPLSASFEAADARVDGARERALDVTEELGFGQALGNGGGVEGHERLVAPRTVVVNRAGDQFLARAGFALNQHRAVHRRHEFQRVEQPLHARAGADEAAEAEAVVQLGLELGVLRLQASLAERRLQHLHQLDELEGLDEEVHGAALERANRVVDAAEARGDHAAHVRVTGQRFVEHVEPVAVGQLHVDDQRVVGEAVEARQGIGGVWRSGRRRSRRLRASPRSSGGSQLRLRRRARSGGYGRTRQLLGRGEALVHRHG